MSNNEKPAYERTKLVLEINHLTKKFAVDGGKFLTACNDINLRAYEGRTLGIIGESGCGKSTLVRTLLRIHPATSGEAIFEGHDLMKSSGEQLRQDRKNIQMVFQDPTAAFNPKMLVKDILTEPLKNFGLIKNSEVDAKAAELLEMVELPAEFKDRYPHSMSGGQRQRVALGRALVRDPQVFLLDEPLGNLDAKLRDQVRYELKKIQTQLGVTTIYVTHDQTEAMTMADHIVLMKDGHIMQQGTPNDLYAHPNSLFVASFVGTPQINKLTCKVVEKGGSLAFQCGELLLSVPDDLTALMQQYKGKEVIVGLRPSELTLAPEGQGEIEGTVDSVEPLGDGFIVYLKAAGQMLVAKIAGGSTVIGKTISLNIEKGKFHIFDSQTEERLNP